MDKNLFYGTDYTVADNVSRVRGEGGLAEIVELQLIDFEHSGQVRTRPFEKGDVGVHQEKSVESMQSLADTWRSWQ
ncbi:hypothetical protein HDU98_000044 [Podochytrium sp. JEL0797]|nr:hypothetical protein HDU98_000044 [Podochytrium sp. JEL0797]